MHQHMFAAVPQPRTDDRPLWNLLTAARGYTVVLVAHDLRLFPCLAERPRTLKEVCQALGLATSPAEALLTALESLALVQSQNGHYALTPFAEDFLLDGSPTYFGWYLDREIANLDMFSFDSLKDTLRKNTPLTARNDRTLFARAMHSMSMGPALAWPHAIDLSNYQLLLDVGGGSGAHSIAAVRQWPHLQAMVFDKDATMLQLAQEFIERYGVQGRVHTQMGDMLDDPFPPADLHFYSAIHHHWSVDRCRLLSAKSYARLPSGGRIIIHERVYDDDRKGPFPVVALTMPALLRGEGGRYAARDYVQMLREAGFTDIVVTPTFGYWSIVTGRKA